MEKFLWFSASPLVKLEKVENRFINKKTLFFILENSRFFKVFSLIFVRTKNKSKTRVIYKK